MANGFIIVDENDWEIATSDQREWMIFKTLRSMDDRLKSLERWNKCMSFAGGIVGGFIAVGIYGILKFVG